MALQIKLFQKMMVPKIRAVGVPLSSLLALRFISECSMLNARSNSKIVPRRLMTERQLVFNVMKPSPMLHQVRMNSYRTRYSENTQEDMLTPIFETKTFLSVAEWQDVFDLIVYDRRFSNVTTFDGLIMKFCLFQRNWSLANSYLDFLKLKQSEPNLLALGYYLQLCGLAIEECGESKVLDVYKQLSSKAKVFDVTLSESAIFALSKTSEWKQGLKYLPVIRQLCFVKSNVYSALSSAAFKNGDYDTGWQLLETMHKEGKEPLDEVFIEWIRQCGLGEDKEAMTNTLLQKFEHCEIYPRIPAAEEIMRFFREELKWSGRYVQIFHSGKCPACNQELEHTDVDETAFMKLREEFVSRILLGSDIYKTTSPEEWARFVDFLEEEGPFTTVVDGLNVACTVGRMHAGARMKRLREAISKIKVSNRKSNILVIGRKHMETWSTRDLDAIKKRAKVFTLDNLSKDDGFFIYAALQSGLGTEFVSSDLLRDHLYRLEDPLLKKTFRHWQRKHQILAVPSPVGVHLVTPPKFKPLAQNKDGESWHIPYTDSSINAYYVAPHTWLCLHSNPQFHKEMQVESYTSETPFESSKKDRSIPYLRNPKKFGIQPGKSKGDFITLTDEIPGSKASSPMVLDIKYGKVRMEEDSRRNYKKNDFYTDSRNYSGNSRKPFKDYRTYSEDSGEPRSLYDKPKGVHARNKMKKDMRNIINSSKDTVDKRKSSSIDMKNLFNDT